MGGIVVGSDRALWFLGVRPGAPGMPPVLTVFRITTSGALTSFALPIPGSFAFVADIAAGPDGKLWYVVQGTFACGFVGSIATDGTLGSVITLCKPNSIATGSAHITGGPEHDLFVTIFNFFENGYSAVYRLSTTGEIRKEFILPNGSDPEGIVAGPDHSMWITLDGSNAIARLDTRSGAFTMFPLPTPHALPICCNLDQEQISQIIAGPDGASWFVEYGVNQIGRITTSGKITEFRIPTPNSGPSGIATCSQPCAGPRDVWFAESLSNKVANFKL